MNENNVTSNGLFCTNHKEQKPYENNFNEHVNNGGNKRLITIIIVISAKKYQEKIRFMNTRIIKFTHYSLYI